MRQLEGRIAVVTGGASGIGAALVRACAAAGMDVAVSDLDAAGAERVAAAAREQRVRAIAVATDVGDRASVEALAERSYSELGGCHLLCNNAGVFALGALDEQDEAAWRRAIDVNLMGVVHGIAAFVPRMKAAPAPAHIVNVASMSGLLAFPKVGVYAATKYAVVGLSETLRQELSAHGIGVTVVCPGGVKTGLIGRTLEGAAPELGEELLEVMRATGEGPEDILEPEAVATAILAAVHDDAPYALTHPKYRKLLEQRFEQILAAVGGA